MHPQFPHESSVDAPSGKVVATGLDLIVDRLDEARDAQADANRAHARQWSALAELMRLARANPHIFLRSAGLAQHDVFALAEEAAAFDAGLRLNLSAGQVRNLAHRAQVLEDQMPRLRAAFAAGDTSASHVDSALSLLVGWMDETAIKAFDEELVAAASNLSPAAFRNRARRLKEKLMHEPAEARHARAFADRRVAIEPEEDGMAWIHLLVSAPDAVRILSRLNATARAVQKKTKISEPGWRSRDQIRADLAVAWLAGDGTPTAAKVRPILLVPMFSMIGEGSEPIELPGYGTIDRAAAAKLFEQAPSFRRVGTDPFTGEKLVYDHRRYRPTQAQRDWIAMRFENCIDPACARPVGDTDIDHLEEWVRDHGRTNDDNLFPLCEKGNRRKHLSRFGYEHRGNSRVAITTPTGLTVISEPPPF